MSDQPTGVFLSPQRAIEEAFVALLKASPALTNLDVVAASNRDALVPPLHCFVSCPDPDSLLPTGPIYKTNLTVALVTNIDDHNDTTRQFWWNLILQILGRPQEEQEFDHEFAVIKGWSIKVVGEVSAGQSTGDVARLTVGAIV